MHAHRPSRYVKQVDYLPIEVLIDPYSRPEPIIANLYGDDVATTVDVRVESPAPVPELTRRPIDRGVDPATPLHVFRNRALALIVRSIGEAAQLEINGHGKGFRHRQGGGGLMTGIHTVAGLRKVNRRLDRRRAGVERTLGEMKRGASLHLQYVNGRDLWALSTGLFVSAEVAAVVTERPEIVAVGDGLFRNIPGQTWRYTEEDTR